MFDNEYNYDDELDESTEEENPIARCEECDELIYEDSEDAYIDDEGNYYCCLQCALNHYSIRQVNQYD